MNINDIILSCRVRLARNISGYPFPHKLDDAKAQELILAAEDALGDEGAFRLIRMADISQTDKLMLVERHLCSMELIGNKNGALLINADDTISIMINEEDHLRIQSILPGLDLAQAYDIGAKIEMKLEKKLKFAFDAQLGYLTACPTNLGTGMRASAMIHLAGLAMVGQADSLLANVTKLGYAVRGFYGEGSTAPGNIYQISNQATLGLSEYEIISGLTNMIGEIAGHETAMRNTISSQEELELADIVWRAYGVCQRARKMAYAEFMEQISRLKLAASLGIIEGLSVAALDNLLLSGQPGSLHAKDDLPFDEKREEVARAALVRKALEEH